MAVFSVFAVVDGDRVAFGESDGVADGLTAADDGYYARDIVVLLEGRNEGM